MGEFQGMVCKIYLNKAAKNKHSEQKTTSPPLPHFSGFSDSEKKKKPFLGLSYDYFPYILFQMCTYLSHIKVNSFSV